ncbi:MAG: hypothetical protein ACKVX7_03510 [Planctomycetota bacterium]
MSDSTELAASGLGYARPNGQNSGRVRRLQAHFFIAYSTRFVLLDNLRAWVSIPK